MFGNPRKQTCSLIVLFVFTLSRAALGNVNNFIYVGEGTLVTLEEESYYGVVVYANVASETDPSVKIEIMSKAAEQMGSFCIGFMVDTGNRRGALIYDMSIVSTQWPPVSPSMLSHAPVQWNSEGGEWNGKGLASLRTSVSVDKGWETWQCFAKPKFLAITKIGEGTLVSENEKTWYAVRQYKNIASTPEEVKLIMLRAMVEAGDACVGYHFRPIRRGGRYLEAALLYDRSKSAEWPPTTPASLRTAGVSWSSDWDGNGPVSYGLSIDHGKGWNGWECYAKTEMLSYRREYLGDNMEKIDS